MKHAQLYINLAILAAGILLIVFHNQNLITTLIVLLGIAMMIPCLATLFAVIFRRDKDAQGNTIKPNKALFASTVITSLCGIGLGTWMILSPSSLVGIMVYLFAAIIIIAGLYQLIMLAIGHRPIKFPWWMYIMPTLMTLAGIVILTTDVKTLESIVVLITGISLVAYAINRFAELLKTVNEQNQQQS